MKTQASIRTLPAFQKLIIAMAVFAAGLSMAAVEPNPSSPVGGNFVMNLQGEPPTLHPINAEDLYSRRVWDFTVDSLAARNPNTAEFVPRVAESWEWSKDKKSITFQLRKDVQFHDGKPLTAEDVKFSFDAIFNPAYMAAHLRPYYDKIEKVEVLDPYKVKVVFKEFYFLNFASIATMNLIPKHIYGDVEASKKMLKTIVSCGPYKLDKLERGQRVVLKRNLDWYGFKTALWKDYYKFDTITMKFVKEDAVAIEMLRKGDLDYDVLTSEQYFKKTEGAPFGTKVLKVQFNNKVPRSYGFIGWNFKKPIFQDRKVRQALAYLMNREEMNKKFRNGNGIPLNGPEYYQAETNDHDVKAIPFDPKKAQALFAEAGWKDTDNNGVLDKMIDGKKVEMRFTLIHANKDSEKYHTLYKEDLKKAGVDMEVKYVEWNSFTKSLDDQNFDAVAMGWASTLDSDYKQIWHSSSAVAGGSNFISYKNPEADKLIEQARVEPDDKKRASMQKKIFRLIAEDAPYAFLFNDKSLFYAVNSRIGRPGDAFEYEVGIKGWWIKP
jgi:microcin C transport system substrate-binding protein